MPTPSKPLVIFLAECHADTAVLSEIRNVPARHPNTTRHLKGIGRVANAMLKLPDRIVVGLIDDDGHRKAQKLNVPNYFKAFRPLAEPAPDGFLTFLKHPDFQHYLIRITPACERWLLACAHEAGLMLTFEQIEEVTKKEDSDTDLVLLGWVKAIYRAQASGFQAVEAFIAEFEAPRPRYH